MGTGTVYIALDAPATTDSFALLAGTAQAGVTIRGTANTLKKLQFLGSTSRETINVQQEAD
jgi:hypothetical protein